jgi:hypothetical protein
LANLEQSGAASRLPEQILLQSDRLYLRRFRQEDSLHQTAYVSTQSDNQLEERRSGFSERQVLARTYVDVRRRRGGAGLLLALECAGTLVEPR